MKVDQTLIRYLLKNKELPLQGIGIIKLADSFSPSSDPEEPLVIPEGDISFIQDNKVKEDPNLVRFISETTGKIEPLASADLDSYITLGKQFINLGKSLNIPFIGSIERDHSGKLILKAETTKIEKEEITKKHTVKVEDHSEEVEDAKFDEFPSRRENKGKNFLYLLILIILGLAVWAVWKYAFNQEENDTITTTQTENETPASLVPDSTDTASTPAILPATVDTVGFKVLVGQYYSLSSGQKRIDDLTEWGRRVTLSTNDSSTYRVYEMFPNFDLSDTTKVIDSLGRYYGPRKFTVEKLN